MNREDLPSLYRMADGASARAQRAFVRLTTTRLVAMVAVAAAGTVFPLLPNLKAATPWAAAIGFGTALFISVFLKVRRFDDRWFQARAVAENVKRLAWLYAVRVASDGKADTSTQPDRDFVVALNGLRERVRSLAPALALELSEGAEITAAMRACRVLPFPDRLTSYRGGRLANQIAWYSENGTLNARKEETFANFTLLFEFVALVVALLQASLALPWSPAGIGAAILSAMTAWVQLKRYSDLSITYSVAHGDLQGLDSQYAECTEEQFPEFVHQVEQAVSREHTVWLARRTR